ncbi:MAG: ABC transporter permease [Desulfuromonas sp.]|uniref:ABC transporter permease n=1 Tax=Desulfuromonas sp. TaxID=892 RepID=UPI000CB185F6|nr:ABC transporter permease [Desulfuromonas sp.]PLX84855.1 MAG: ABC transporter permease [Desulfuromonas sp.]
MSDSFDISWRFLRVWQRNLSVYRRTWKVNFLPPLLEPLLYLLAFGVGLSSLVGALRYGGEEVSYLAFIAPALLSVNIMYNAFFETSYASFVRMYYQKTFDAMLATPLNLEEIIVGEIAWAATKAIIGTTIMLAVISLFGLVAYPGGLLLIPLALLGGVAFASVGMVFTSVVPNIETFNIPIFLFITPMFLFSGTFFPLENLPAWARLLAQALPLTHLVGLARALTLGQWSPGMLWSLGYLAVFCALFLPLAVTRMRRRLIR